MKWIPLIHNVLRDMILKGCVDDDDDDGDGDDCDDDDGDDNDEEDGDEGDVEGNVDSHITVTNCRGDIQSHIGV